MNKPLHFRMPENEDRVVIIIPGQGSTIGGIAYHYKEFYPPELEAYIDFDDYQRIITDINETVKSFWPCFFTICMGYVLCPVTLGLSLLLPQFCLGDCEKEIKKIVNTANIDCFNPRGAHMEFKKERFKSCFQIILPYSAVPIQKSNRAPAEINSTNGGNNKSLNLSQS